MLGSRAFLGVMSLLGEIMGSPLIQGGEGDAEGNSKGRVDEKGNIGGRVDDRSEGERISVGNVGFGGEIAPGGDDGGNANVRG